MTKNPPDIIPSRSTVAAGFVTGMLAGLAAQPDGPSRITRLLAETGISRTVLDDPDERINVARYAALYNQLIRELDDEGFGLFTHPLRAGSFEFLCRSVITATTLREALDRAARFLRLVLPDFAVLVDRPRGNGARIVVTLQAGSPLTACDPGHPGRVFAFEWLLRLLHALACWLVGRGLSLDAVAFPFPRPQHADDYALIYTEHSQFFSANAALSSTAGTLVATFAAHLLELPVRRDDTALAAFLDGSPGKISWLYRRDRETVQRVRDLMRDALPELPSLGELAKQLNLSERSLHRRLESEGTNFRAIREALRRDIALSRLSKSRLPIANIAAELGYAEPSAFYRAVVSWTGASPLHYRQQTATAKLPKTLKLEAEMPFPPLGD